MSEARLALGDRLALDVRLPLGARLALEDRLALEALFAPEARLAAAARLAPGDFDFDSACGNGRLMGESDGDFGGKRSGEESLSTVVAAFFSVAFFVDSRRLVEGDFAFGGAFVGDFDGDLAVCLPDDFVRLSRGDLDGDFDALAVGPCTLR